MKEKWEKLIELLNEMIELYSTILVLSKDKREALIEVKPQKLEAVTQQEELLIVKVGKLEASRGKIMREIAEACGVELEELTLSGMVELAGPNYSERLTKVADDFDRIMGELVVVNRLNAELIEQALGFINFNINVLAQSTTASTYAPQGQVPKGNDGRKLIDRRI
ncbi:MAG: FlgN protein [Firmicutes bacterium]|nr:FlgN protein [Bacillota bacterium]